jgi:hypothetical protein
MMSDSALRAKAWLSTKTRWWVFCLTIVSVKFLLLAIDPKPELFLGDSMTYIMTGVTGRIPGDRSYFYGYIIRWLALPVSSLLPLLVVQTALGAIIALMVAWICRVFFELPERFAYFFGILCAIDPLHVTWERYVMTETFTICFYTVALQQSFAYLRDRRVGRLVLIQLLSIITIGFRMVFLPVVVAMAVALPLLAFLFPTSVTETVARAGRFGFLRRTQFWQHLSASVLSLFLLDQVYTHTYGFISHREPAHLYDTGYFLLAIWAPAIQPEDAPDPRLAKLIEQGDEFDLRDIWGRAGQRWHPNLLIRRWLRIESDQRKSNEIARQTALNAFRRDPLVVLALAVNTYLEFWKDDQMKAWLPYDLGRGKLANSHLKLLIDRFHWQGQADIANEPQTFVKRYYQAASPYYFFVLLSPLLAFVLLLVTSDKVNAWLLLIHTWMLFAVTLLLSVAPIIRYFEPLSVLTLLIAALIVKSVRLKAETLSR